jgi:hypothetical protein
LEHGKTQAKARQLTAENMAWLRAALPGVSGSSHIGKDYDYDPLTFVVLMLSKGSRYSQKPAMFIALGDLTLVLLFGWYLVADFL